MLLSPVKRPASRSAQGKITQRFFLLCFFYDGRDRLHDLLQWRRGQEYTTHAELLQCRDILLGDGAARDDFRNAITQGPPASVFRGPILADAPYLPLTFRLNGDETDDRGRADWEKPYLRGDANVVKRQV